MKKTTLLKLFGYGLFYASCMLTGPLAASVIGVASARVTQDQRPLLWQNHDTQAQDHQIALFWGKVGDYLGIINSADTNQVWAGVNSVGLAIVGAIAEDLEGDFTGSEGSFIKRALSECANLEQLEALLKQTNQQPGRSTQCNLGVIDAKGQAAIFEVGNYSYIKFDANDVRVAPTGFLVRTNFAITGRGTGMGSRPYHRAQTLFKDACDQKKLGHRFLIQILARDLVGPAINPYPLPFSGSYEDFPAGAIDTQEAINSFQTAWCAVFRGVRSHENPKLSTLWWLPGEPVFGIAVPLWVHAGPVPELLTSIQQKMMRQKRRAYSVAQRPSLLNTNILAGSRFSIWPEHLLEEEKIFGDCEKMLQTWRKGKFTHEGMRQLEYLLAERVFQALR